MMTEQTHQDKLGRPAPPIAGDMQDPPAAEPASRRRWSGTRLSTRLLLAYAILVLVYFILMTIPAQVLLRRDYVSEAAASFAASLDRHTPELVRAADQGDRISLDLLCATLNTDFQGRVTLIATDGAVIADSVSARCLARARPECIPLIQAQRQRILQQYMPLDDTVTVRLPLHLGSRGPATARLTLPLGPVQAKLRRMNSLLVVTACGAMLLAMGIGLFVSRRIARPVEQMTHVAEQIAAGDFAGSPPPAGTDEIGRLAQALTNMQRTLAATMSQLELERNQALAMVQHLTDGVIALDTEDTVLYANDAASALLGSGPITAGTLLAAPRAIHDVLTEARRCHRERRGEIGEVRRDDRVIGFQAIPVSAPRGQAPSAILVLRDMTEARRAENLGRELVANASHELRTPLAVIGSSAETLLEAKAVQAPQHQDFLQIIARQAQRLETLVSETLRLSQLDAARPSDPRAVVSLTDLVQEVVATLAPAAANRAIDLQVTAAPENPLVSGFGAILRQGITNLVENAIRYTPAGGRVRITLETTADTATVAVRDTGPGIPPAEQGRIFERFVRGRQHTGDGVEGSGMGLAIVRRVAELHQGHIDLDSRPGEGSCFSLRLPRTTVSQPSTLKDCSRT